MNVSHQVQQLRSVSLCSPCTSLRHPLCLKPASRSSHCIKVLLSSQPKPSPAHHYGPSNTALPGPFCPSKRRSAAVCAAGPLGLSASVRQDLLSTTSLPSLLLSVCLYATVRSCPNTGGLSFSRFLSQVLYLFLIPASLFATTFQSVGLHLSLPGVALGLVHILLGGVAALLGYFVLLALYRGSWVLGGRPLGVSQSKMTIANMTAAAFGMPQAATALAQPIREPADGLLTVLSVITIFSSTNGLTAGSAAVASFHYTAWLTLAVALWGLAGGAGLARRLQPVQWTGSSGFSSIRGLGGVGDGPLGGMGRMWLQTDGNQEVLLQQTTDLGAASATETRSTGSTPQVVVEANVVSDLTGATPIVFSRGEVFSRPEATSSYSEPEVVVEAQVVEEGFSPRSWTSSALVKEVMRTARQTFTCWAPMLGLVAGLLSAAVASSMQPVLGAPATTTRLPWELAGLSRMSQGMVQALEFTSPALPVMCSLLLCCELSSRKELPGDSRALVELLPQTSEDWALLAVASCCRWVLLPLLWFAAVFAASAVLGEPTFFGPSQEFFTMLYGMLTSGPDMLLVPALWSSLKTPASLSMAALIVQLQAVSAVLQMLLGPSIASRLVLWLAMQWS